MILVKAVLVLVSAAGIALAQASPTPSIGGNMTNVPTFTPTLQPAEASVPTVLPTVNGPHPTLPTAVPTGRPTLRRTPTQAPTQRVAGGSTVAQGAPWCVPPLCGCPNCPKPPSPPVPKPTPRPTLPPPPSSIRGYTKCKYGDVDCNMCVHDVEGSFERAFEDDGMGWKNWRWHLYYNNEYRPANKGPKSGGIAGWFEWHIQGFARTNNETIRYAASHSNSKSKNGGYYFIKKDDRNSLYAMHLAQTDHPNSVAEIGQYVVTAGDGTDDVRFFDLRKIRSPQDVRRNVPGIDTGGGLGMARLADGAYMLVANTYGEIPKHRYAQFYRWEGPLTKPTSVKLLASSPYSQPSHWTEDFEGSDNLSLITECGTGRLYTIHASGDSNWHEFVSRGHWRLSRVDWDEKAGKPVLKTLDGYKVSQDKRNCHLRSAGTVHATRNHKLEFYCHERNLVHGGILSHDEFFFKLGQPRD